MEDDIKSGAALAIPKRDAARCEIDLVGMTGIALTSAAECHDTEMGQRPHFVGIADAVAVGVHPYRQPVQFLAAQYAVAIVVQRAQRLVTMLPEGPETDAAEHLQRRAHLAVAPRPIL